jgi:hypothetical protein
MGAEAKRYLQEHSIPQLFEVKFKTGVDFSKVVWKKIYLFILCGRQINSLFGGSNYPKAGEIALPNRKFP